MTMELTDFQKEQQRLTETVHYMDHILHRKELTIMKSKEELNALKEEVETVNKKLAELTDEELAQVSGGQLQKMEDGDPLYLL